MHIIQATALQGEGGSCPRGRWLPSCAEERPGAGDISRLEIKVRNCPTLCHHLVASAEEIVSQARDSFQYELIQQWA